MADIVGEAQRLGQIFVQTQGAGQDTADLRDFDAVRQAGAVMIAIGRDEDLRLGAQAAEGDRMDDPVPVALELAARSAHFAARDVVRYGKFPPAREGRVRGVCCAIHRAERLGYGRPSGNVNRLATSSQAPIKKGKG